MSRTVTATIETDMDPVLYYLPPVSFMQLIGACSYLYSKQKDKIQEKRKESLVQLMGYGNLQSYSYMYRGTRLPNGRIEGKFEVIDDMYYIVANYTNSKQVGCEIKYHHFRSEGEIVVVGNMQLFVRTLNQEFLNWGHINTSGMKLVSKTKQDRVLACKYYSNKASTQV